MFVFPRKSFTLFHFTVRSNGLALPLETLFWRVSGTSWGQFSAAVDTDDACSDAKARGAMRSRPPPRQFRRLVVRTKPADARRVATLKPPCFSGRAERIAPAEGRGPLRRRGRRRSTGSAP